MASNHDSGAKSRISGMIPTNHKEAMFLLKEQRSRNQREQVPMADLIREFVEDGLAAHYDELPEEAKDLLDEDMVANAGGGELTVEIEEDVEA